ncbi:MAG: transglycosylase domain-containing protein [Patescibacteria group bacterium]
MAKKTRKVSFVNPASRTLGALGRPFYLLLSRLVLVIVFILFLTGRTVRIILKSRIRIHWKNKIFPFFLFFISLVFSFWFFILRGLPSPQELTNRQVEVSTKIYDRNGVLLYKIYKDKNRTIVSLDQIPLHVRLATLAAEDAEFYDHPGFSIKGISRAIKQNLKSKELQGGSTITQQLVKNALLTPERTFLRKIREIVLSIRAELAFTKDQILEMYLNEISFGGTAYGIEEASYEYFGKGVGEINLAEAAFLAGLPQSPTKYSPFGQNPDLGFARQKEVLRLMRINRFITPAQEESVLNQKLIFAINITQIKAPHFIFYVRQALVDIYGEEMVERGGLEVTTSLDFQIQELAEKVVKSEMEKLKNLHVGNGAAIIMDPKNGQVLAMVGSKNYFNIENDGQVNVTTSSRQPGSSIKVINYAYALSNGYSPATILDDSPIAYAVPGQPLYSPKNYDGQFKGRMTTRVALAESRNIPAVKILASYGVAKMIDLGQKMGITTWDDTSRFGLSLTLGGGEVKLIELAQVYSTIANYGQRPEIVSILQVKDYKGNLLEESKVPQILEVIDKRVAYMLTDILKDNYARAGEFGLNSYLVVKNHPEVAVKTGTSNDLRDNLAVGFNKDYLVAVWVGNNNNSPMARIASGITGASPIWNKIMSALLSDKPSLDWKIPDGLIKINCEGKSEWFLEEDQNKTKYCLPSVNPDTKDNKVKEKVPQIL